MRNDQFFAILENIDERYIEEAENYRVSNTNNVLTRYIGLAAAAVLILVTAGFILILNIRSNDVGDIPGSEETVLGASIQTTDISNMTPTGAYDTQNKESVETWNITNPTGLPNGYYEQPMVMYNGIVYKYYATGVAKELPDGYVLVGTIKEFDWKNIPSDDFQATGTDLHIGQEVYANPDKPDEILVRYVDNDGWNGYGSFYTDDATKMDVNGYDIEMQNT